MDIEIKKRKMISDSIYDKIMPIYTKPIYLKFGIFIYVYFRVLIQLLKDLYDRPDIIILSRRFINRVLPFSYKLIVNHLIKNGTKLIWDFDDEIIETKEVTQKGFDYLAHKSEKIIVASPVHLNMIPSSCLKKTIILPTTDGSMYNCFCEKINMIRLNEYDNKFKIIWVGTSISLPFVLDICKYIESAAKYFSGSRQFILTIICNEPLEYSPTNFKLRNIKWSRDIALKELLENHIGIMPLPDEIKTKAKGGFKLIQYLSVGLPVIGSAIGINKSIIDKSVGYAIDADKTDSWHSAFISLANDKQKWEKMSLNAYSKWNKNYSYETNLNIWQSIINYD